MTGFTAPAQHNRFYHASFQMRTRVELLSLLGGIYQDARSNTLIFNGTRINPVLVPYCFTFALQNCCCQTQQNIIKMGYENQLGQKDIVNQMQTGFSYTNAGLERAASNLGFQMSQMACDLKTNANVNTQRIVDVLNNHWQSDLQQRYNDARLELSQQKQNATLIAALKTTTTAAA